MNRLPTIIRQHIAAFRAMLVFTVITGIIYPVFMWGVAQAAFTNQADGSLVSYNGQRRRVQPAVPGVRRRQGQPVAAVLPAAAVRRHQRRGRPTTAATRATRPRPTSGRTARPCLQDVQQRRAAIAKFDGVSPSQVPPDALTASGVGPRPGHLAPERRHPGQPGGSGPGTCRSRRSRRWSASTPQGRNIGILGEPRVDVLDLNIALDELPGPVAVRRRWAASRVAPRATRQGRPDNKGLNMTGLRCRVVSARRPHLISREHGCSRLPPQIRAMPASTRSVPDWARAGWAVSTWGTPPRGARWP